MDADIKTDGGRLLQLTPPGSPCSIIIGTGLTSSAPGSAQWLHLIVSDIEAARADLVSHGVDASEVYHDSTGGYNRWDPAVRASGPDPDRRTYASFLTFPDPDGNLWVLQEITTRFEGRIDSGATTFADTSDLANAMRRASVAHGEHEKRTGAADENWPDWYAVVHGGGAGGRGTAEVSATRRGRPALSAPTQTPNRWRHCAARRATR